MDRETLMRRLKPPYLAREFRRIRTKYLRKLRGVDRKVVTLAPAGQVRGRVLLSYIIDPFLLAEDEVPHSHTHFWESLTIGRTWAELGHEVDVISWTNLEFVPRKEYDVLIDVRLNLERLAPLQPGAFKILHTDTSHYTFNNPAQERRRKAIEARRGVALRPIKNLPENRAAETADAIVYLGNDFTRETYDFAGKSCYRVPVSVPFTYEWPQGKNFEAARRRFLWFGSGGLVHKGLDLVLEAFAELPDYHLTVCGPIDRESDFERAYSRELYGLPNIQTVGWIDVSGASFEDLARRTLALVYPSCAEGGGSSVLTCMHTGMIPIVTRESSVDLDPSYGIELRDASVARIRKAVTELAEREPAELETMARLAWSFARGQHTKEHFCATYRQVAENLASSSG